MVNLYEVRIQGEIKPKPLHTESAADKKSAKNLTRADYYNNYSRIEERNSDIFKASDGHEYNIMEIVLSRVINLAEAIGAEGDERSKLVSVFDSDDVKQIFESQTGKEYNPQNIEMFLKGELKLLPEKNADEQKLKAYGKILNPPYIRDNALIGKTYGSKRKTLTEKEKVYYAKIYSSLDKETKLKFEKCLKSGKLLLNDSNDNSTILKNLYRIFSEPRAKEVNRDTIIKECINILDNPLIVTQNPEDIPAGFIKNASEYVFNQEEAVRERKRAIAKHSAYMMLILEDEEYKDKATEMKRITEMLANRNLGTCVAASIEFVMASKHPAEFIRIIAGLTSEKKEVKKMLDLRKADLMDDDLDFIKIPNKLINNRRELTLKADNGAYFLANMQKVCQDNDERTTIDILFQSMIFQIGTQGSYNSISDKHSSLFNKEDGLNNIEENYILQVLFGVKPQDMVYREYNSDWSLDKEVDNSIIEKDIDSALRTGKYILIGINCSDTTDYTDGHELTIIGKTKGLDGTEYYVCKDTDQSFTRPVQIKKEFLLENIINTNIIN